MPTNYAEQIKRIRATYARRVNKLKREETAKVDAILILIGLRNAEIRTLHLQGLTHPVIAKRFGLSITRVRQIAIRG